MTIEMIINKQSASTHNTSMLVTCKDNPAFRKLKISGTLV